MIYPEASTPSDEGDAGARLSLHEQFQIFAALRWRGANGRRWLSKHVARAFGVSAFTISQIKNCQTTMSEPKRYQKIKEEWDARDETEFMRRYYTLDLHDKLIAARRSFPVRILK